MFAYCNNDPVNRTDPSGESGWFIVANAVIGAAVGTVTQVSTNIITGKSWHSGVLGAALGGATYNVVALLTGSLTAASASGSAVEALTSEVIDYASGKKQVNTDNILNSAANVVCKTAENTITASITGKIASKVVYTNSKWFQPKKFSSSFTGNYAKRVFFQTAVQGELTMIYNSIRSAAQQMNSN